MKSLIIIIIIILTLSCLSAKASEFQSSPIYWDSVTPAFIKTSFKEALGEFKNDSSRVFIFNKIYTKLSLNIGTAYANNNDGVTCRIYLHRADDGIKIDYATIFLSEAIDWRKHKVLLHRTLYEALKKIFEAEPKEIADYYYFGVDKCEVYDINK